MLDVFVDSYCNGFSQARRMPVIQIMQNTCPRVGKHAVPEQFVCDFSNLRSVDSKLICAFLPALVKLVHSLFLRGTNAATDALNEWLPSVAPGRGWSPAGSQTHSSRRGLLLALLRSFRRGVTTRNRAASALAGRAQSCCPSKLKCAILDSKLQMDLTLPRTGRSVWRDTN